MKRWVIKHEEVEYVCSLLAHAGKAKITALRCDGGNNIHFQFLKFYDFAAAKEGKKQTGWVKLPHTNDIKVRASIIFK